MERLRTLDELADAVAERLDAEGTAPDNGQVTSRPDPRTLRYYTTLGLLDRAVARRGRLSLYGDRHLAQTLAVKRLQAAGWPLADIQRRLIGLPTAELQRVRTDEAVPVTPLSEDAPILSAPNVSASDRPERAVAAAPRRNRAFWAEPTGVRDDPGVALVGIHLPAGAVLLLPTRQPLTAADVAALRHSAQPLVAEAVRRRLLDVNDQKFNDTQGGTSA